MIAALLLAALALDLALAFIAGSPGGLTRAIGPFRLRLHDPTALLTVAALLAGATVAWCWRSRARGRSLVAAVVVVAIGTIALTRAAEPMFPTGDIALIELYVRNALSGQLLVGPYSRFGWHHPGPMYFYLLAPFYAAAERRTASLAAGSAVAAMLAAAAAAWAAARALGPRASAVTGAALLFLVWRVPALTASAWNPHIVVIPAFALVIVCASAAGGDLVMIPVVVVIASFVAQTDAALVPLAVALGVSGVAAGVLTSWRTERSRALAALNAGAWVAAAMWILPVAEQLTHHPGNMTLLWRFFGAAHGRGQTLAHAAAAWAEMLAGPFLPSLGLATGGTFEAGHPGIAIPIAIAQLCALSSIAVGMRTRAPGVARLAMFALAGSLLALWSATRIEDRIMDHQVFWISAIGAVNMAVLVAALGEALPRARLDEVSSGIVHGAAVAGVAAICFAQSERARAGRMPVTPTNPAAERLALSMRAYVERSGHKPLVRIGESTWSLAAGVLLQADRLGVPFAVEADWVPMFPQSFAANGDEDVDVAFGNGDEHVERLDNGATPIDTFSTVYMDGKKR